MAVSIRIIYILQNMFLAVIGFVLVDHHQATDTIDVSPEFSFDHILRFTKLAVAFAVELSDY